MQKGHHLLREFRRSAGLSVDGMSKLLDVSVATISRLENGKQRPSWRLMGRIVEVTSGAVRPDHFTPGGERREAGQ